jgi:hypothetical protein
MQRFLVGVFLALVSASLPAQTINMRATIPFAFHAGDKLMPAGEYTVKHANHTLIMQEVRGNDAVVLLTNAAQRVTTRSVPSVEFHRYGENYFLYSVWDGASGDGAALPKTRAEKETAGRAGPGRSASVVLQRQ